RRRPETTPSRLKAKIRKRNSSRNVGCGNIPHGSTRHASQSQHRLRTNPDRLRGTTVRRHIPRPTPFCGSRSPRTFLRRTQRTDGWKSMSNLSEDSSERASRYIATLEKTLQQHGPLKESKMVGEASIMKVSDAIHRYLQDARFYVKNGKTTTSLASVAYA